MQRDPTQVSPARNPFLFLFGCPRSGTTLLQRMLDAHGDLAMAPNIGWLASAYRDDVGLTADGLVTREFLDDYERRPRLFRRGHLPVTRAQLDERLERGPLTYAQFLSWMFDLYGEARRKRYVGTKSWPLARDFPTVHRLWPQAVVVHLVRDGRDTALSMLSWRRADKMWRFATWEHDPVGTAALWWEWHVRVLQDLLAIAGPDRSYEIRYEALVARPERECAGLCGFLGVPYDAAMVRYHEGRTIDDPALDAKHAWLPPTPGLRDWRRQMAPGDVERFEAVAGGLLEELGYPLGSEPTEAARERAAWLRTLFVPRGPMPSAWRPPAPVLGEAR
jgi:Sulfotransferase family